MCIFTIYEVFNIICCYSFYLRFNYKSTQLYCTLQDMQLQPQDEEGSDLMPQALLQDSGAELHSFWWMILLRTHICKFIIIHCLGTRCNQMLRFLPFYFLCCKSDFFFFLAVYCVRSAKLSVMMNNDLNPNQIWASLFNKYFPADNVSL